MEISQREMLRKERRKGVQAWGHLLWRLEGFEECQESGVGSSPGGDVALMCPGTRVHLYDTGEGEEVEAGRLHLNLALPCMSHLPGNSRGSAWLPQGMPTKPSREFSFVALLEIWFAQ